MTILHFQFVEYANPASAFVYAGPRNRRLLDDYKLTAVCGSFASFEKEIDRLHSELEEIRREAHLRWVTHEATLHKVVENGHGRICANDIPDEMKSEQP